MNTLRMYVTGLGILTFVATTAIAHAQTATEPLIVAGTRGSVLTRTLLLQTPSPTNSVQLVPLDLTGTDGNTVLPAGAMSIPSVTVNQIKPDELTVPIQFDLQQVPTSGEFRGNLRLSYQSGAMVVPVMVRVKDFWLLPLLILLTGTALGMAVSAYRAKGQPRDELLVRVGQLRTQIQDDPDLARAGVFQAAVESQLADVRLALQTGRLDTGNAAIVRAEMIWSKWLKGRPDWLAQLAYYDELQQRLKDLNPQIPYVQTIRRHLEDVLRDAPDQDGPDQWRDRLDELAQQINRYLQLQAQMRQMGNLLTQLPSDQTTSWQAQLQQWEDWAATIQPSDLTADTPAITEMRAAIADLTHQVAQQSGSSLVAKSAAMKPGVPLLAPAPIARPLVWDTQISKAGKRLRWFTGMSYAIAVLFLAGAGFNQLYGDNPIFGANPWKDYFALLAWGFGAEATRDAITKVVQGWGLPGVKQE